MKTIESKYFSYDFCEYHTYEFEGKPTLIDLEGIYSVEEYYDLKQHHYNTYTREKADNGEGKIDYDIMRYRKLSIGDVEKELEND